MNAPVLSAPPGYAHRTPGVHFEWLDRPRAAGELRTDVAGFVGIAERGPVGEPVRCETWNQFTSTFGTHVATGYLAYAVEAFFANGGRTCWVVRAAAPDAKPAKLVLADDSGADALELTASTPGRWAHALTVSLARLSKDRFALTLTDADGAIEVWRDLSLAGPLLEGSQLVRAKALGAGTPASRGARRLSGGTDGLADFAPEHLVAGLDALAAVDEVSIVALPDAMRPPRPELVTRPAPPPRCDDLCAAPAPAPPPVADEEEVPRPFDEDEITDLQLALLGHCVLLRDRFAILDTRLGDTSPAQALDWRRRFGPSSPASAFGALYYPWIQAPDPRRFDGPLRALPPCGHVAGIYARGDLRTGVHKPPANERLDNAAALTAATGDAAHGELNDGGVNVIRTAGARIRVLGARTLSGDADWRYVNVRRLLSMIEESIEESAAWAVFEPSAPPLWREIDRVVRGLLDGLWRRGMLDGATADEAYSVRCDETTNTPDEGEVVCLVGVLPPWPAEFVTVRIGITQGAARGVPDAESANG